jgi:hypothetical protein
MTEMTPPRHEFRARVARLTNINRPFISSVLPRRARSFTNDFLSRRYQELTQAPVSRRAVGFIEEPGGAQQATCGTEVAPSAIDSSMTIHSDSGAQRCGSHGEHDRHRVRSEFLEMPGLQLRVGEARRLWGLQRGGVCNHPGSVGGGAISSLHA